MRTFSILFWLGVGALLGFGCDSHAAEVSDSGADGVDGGSDAQMTAVDSGPVPRDDGPEPDPDSGPVDPCLSDDPTTSRGCNGAIAGPAEPGTFGGRCDAFDMLCSEGAGDCLYEDGFADEGMCSIECSPDPAGRLSTSVCPTGSRCWPLGSGRGRCLPDCSTDEDCASDNCVSTACALPVFEDPPTEDQNGAVAEWCDDLTTYPVPYGGFGSVVDLVLAGDLGDATRDTSGYAGADPTVCDAYVEQVARVRIYVGATYRFFVDDPEATILVRRVEDTCGASPLFCAPGDRSALGFYRSGEWEIFVSGPASVGAYEVTVRAS